MFPELPEQELSHPSEFALETNFKNRSVDLISYSFHKAVRGKIGDDPAPTVIPSYHPYSSIRSAIIVGRYVELKQEQQ